MPVATVNDPVMVPALAAEQPTGAPLTGVPLITEPGHVSAKLKPAPVKDIDVPTGPEVGVRVTACETTLNDADAE